MEDIFSMTKYEALGGVRGASSIAKCDEAPVDCICYWEILLMTKLKYNKFMCGSVIKVSRTSTSGPMVSAGSESQFA